MLPQPRDDLADQFATLLKVPRGSISTQTNVLDLGADSIMLLEARSWIETRYGRRIEIRRFFEDLTTIDAIAEFLGDDALARPVAASADPRVHEARETAIAPSHPSDIGLMRAQLALLADVIEAQNRLAASLRRRCEAPPERGGGGGGGRPAGAARAGTEVASA